jgi:hypothetical protein
MRRVPSSLAVAAVVLASLTSPAMASGRAVHPSGAAFHSPAISCSSPLVLHNGTYQTGTSVAVYARGLWVNLSTVGFDNKTSSYRVGACAVELASGSGGGGVHYTHCLSAGCAEDVMDPGWDNVISSVYLH